MCHEGCLYIIHENIDDRLNHSSIITSIFEFEGGTQDGRRISDITAAVVARQLVQYHDIYSMGLRHISQG